eukprot:SAG31_NODE_5883_length_2276_cov_1.101516_1_plen_155_part_00
MISYVTLQIAIGGRSLWWHGASCTDIPFPGTARVARPLSCPRTQMLSSLRRPTERHSQSCWDLCRAGRALDIHRNMQQHALAYRAPAQLESHGAERAEQRATYQRASTFRRGSKHLSTASGTSYFGMVLTGCLKYACRQKCCSLAACRQYLPPN